MTTATSPRTRTHRADPIRWGAAVTVLGALTGLALFFADTDNDAAMWIIVWFGVIGGAIAALRLTGIRFGATGDPRVGGDDQTEIWEGYGTAFADFLRAVGLWLAGGTAVSAVAFVADGAHDATAFVAPLFLGLFWGGAFGIAWLAVALVWIPISILIETWRRRRSAAPVNPWWAYVGAYLMLTVLSAVALGVALTLVPEAMVGSGRSWLSTVSALYSVDVAGRDAGEATAIWIARVVVGVMALAMLVTIVLAGRRLRQLAARRRR